MKALIAALALIAAPALASEKPDPDTQTRIDAMLTEMQCEVDPDDIEAEDDGGWELDDVFCADGQYDIELDADLNVVEKRKE